MAAVIAMPIACLGQPASSSGSSSVRSSAAYSEILLRKTEIQADLEAFSGGYTDVNPRIIDLRAELSSIDTSLERLYKVKPTDSGKLTLALGKLIIKKAVLDTEFSRLARSYAKDHPLVKRAIRRVELFEAAIKEIL
jgi:hypothetical protein